MREPHDPIQVGQITLIYSHYGNGWVTPDMKLIKNPVAAQLYAEKLNDQKKRRR